MALLFFMEILALNSLFLVNRSKEHHHCGMLIKHISKMERYEDLSILNSQLSQTSKHPAHPAKSSQQCSSDRNQLSYLGCNL